MDDTSSVRLRDGDAIVFRRADSADVARPHTTTMSDKRLHPLLSKWCEKIRLNNARACIS
jgi:hypothetical protein